MENIQLSKLTVLVNSCDKYKDLWYPFFELLNINWKSCPYQIVLNTESENYKHENWTIAQPLRILHGGGRTWSERLISCLKQIETEYIMFLLDDFFLHSKVKQDRIAEICLWLDNEKEKKIANFQLYPLSAEYDLEEKYTGFVKAKENYPYLVNCQAAIWRKKALLDILKKEESPWQFEDNGSRRALKKGYEFYFLNVGEPMPEEKAIYHYILSITLGYGVAGGKWLFNNDKLFKAFGINADFSHRSMWKNREEILNWIETNRIAAEENKPSVLKRIVNRIRKIFRG